jgi:hypothetical protein
MSSLDTPSLTPGSAATAPRERLAALEDLERFPLLRSLLEGPGGDQLKAELIGLLAQLAGRELDRAQRFERKFFAKLHAGGDAVVEVGIVHDISSSGIRLRLLRSASLDAIQSQNVRIETRLPGSPMLELEAELVRVAASSDRDVELAFRFTPESANSPELTRLLAALAQRG